MNEGERNGMNVLNAMFACGDCDSGCGVTHEPNMTHADLGGCKTSVSRLTPYGVKVAPRYRFPIKKVRGRSDQNGS